MNAAGARDRPSLGEKLDLVGCPPDEFERLGQMPFDEVVAAVRRAADGEGSDFSFLQLREPKVPALRAQVTDTTPPAAMAARRLLTDQVIQFYLMRALHRMDDAEFADRVEIAGLDTLRESVANGRGVFLLNSHFGPGRLPPVILARLGWTMTSLAPFNFYPMLDIDLSGRVTTIELSRAFGLQVLGQTRAALASGEIVHGTGDGLRGARDDAGIFFGSPRPFADSYAMLAIATGADCLPIFIRSDEQGRIALEINAPLDTGDPATPTADRVAGMVAQYARQLEDKWRSDFGNVPLRCLRLYANQWQRKKLRQPD